MDYYEIELIELEQFEYYLGDRTRPIVRIWRDKLISRLVCSRWTGGSVAGTIMITITITIAIAIAITIGGGSNSLATMVRMGN